MALKGFIILLGTWGSRYERTKVTALEDLLSDHQDLKFLCVASITFLTLETMASPIQQSPFCSVCHKGCDTLSPRNGSILFYGVRQEAHPPQALNSQETPLAKTSLLRASQVCHKA